MFTNKDLRNLIVPLFIEQFLLMFVGIADTFVVSFSSEADVSGVSLVTSFNTVLIFLFTALSSGGAVIISQSAINSLGTVVMAASSAAFNIEIITYDILNSFSQACTTFVGQNFGAGQVDRCKKTLALCLIEGLIALAAALALILPFGKQLLAIFNSDPKVVSTGYIRLVMVMLSHSFSLLYDVISGYLRGFGISLAPALLTILGVCGIRIAWIQFVFPQSRTFQTIMAAYPISLSVTALLIFAALLYYRRPGGLPCRKKANVPPTPGLRKGPCFALCTP